MRTLVLALCLAVLLPAAADAAAKRGTLKGSVSGLKVASGSTGETRVRAFDTRTRRIVARSTISAKGSYKLALPAGTYGFDVYALRLGSRPSFTFKAVGATNMKAGKSKTLKLLSKRPKAKKKAKRKRAARAADVARGFGDVTVPYPAIAVREFTASGFPGVNMGRAMQELTITDLAAGMPPGCRQIAVVERGEHLRDVLAEIARGNDPRFDQATTARPGQLIRDNAEVTGSVTSAGGQVTITATYTEYSGYEATSSVTGPASQFFELQERLSLDLKQKICNPGKAFAGTFSATTTTTNPGSSLTVSMSGNVHLAAPVPPSPSHLADSGSVTVTVKGLNQSGCNFDGTGSFGMGPGAFGPTSILTLLGGKPLMYTLSIQPPGGAVVTVTRSACSDPEQNGTTSQFPVYGSVGAVTRAPKAATGPGITGTDTIVEDGGIGSMRTEANWSLTPSS